MEYEKCYVFQPDAARPTKRRRIEPLGLQSSWALRQTAFRRAWRAQRERIEARLEAISASTVEEVAVFLEEQRRDESRAGRIPTGLILAGPNSALTTAIAARVQARSPANKHRLFATLSAGTAPNLKAALKTIIQRATSRAIEDEDEESEDVATSRKGPKLLNYDLRILHDHVKERRIQQVVLSFEDTEAFEHDTLSDLFSLLGLWQDRIPFVLLLNVATSVDFLQFRLSRAATATLDGRLFDAALSTDEVEQVFETLMDPATELWLGPSLASTLLEQQQDYIQSIDHLVDEIQYAYMSCFYANALAVFLDPSVSTKDVSREHFEALRTLGSFQDHVQRLLDAGQTNALRGLLDSDQHLMDLATEHIAKGRAAMSDAVCALDVIRRLQATLPNTQVSARSSLYLQAMSGKLGISPLLRSLLLSIRKSPSNTARDVMGSICSLAGVADLVEGVGPLAEELDELIREHGGAEQPLRSADDVRNSTVRTTVVAQKVELNKQKSALSKQDTKYTALLRRFSDLLEAYLAEKLVNPKQLLFHEIFFYDLKSPHREVFTARPRHAVERALAAPHDYLGCECCAPGPGGAGEEEEATLAATQPATAVLYQLYLESASLINAHDLCSAFHAVMGETQQGDGSTTALFQRALAELRYLGLVKHTRRRVDHVEKVAWRGL